MRIGRSSIAPVLAAGALAASVSCEQHSNNLLGLDEKTVPITLQ